MQRKWAQKATVVLLLWTFSVQCLAAGPAGFGLAEEFKNMGRGQSEYFSTNRDDRLTVRVNMMNGVASPGIYHIPDNTDINEAIALAGGALSNANLSKVIIKRPVGNTYKVLQYDLEELMEKPEATFPKLSNRDTVMIEVRNPGSLLTNLTILSMIVGIISTGLLVYVTTKNIK